MTPTSPAPAATCQHPERPHGVTMLTAPRYTPVEPTKHLVREREPHARSGRDRLRRSERSNKASNAAVHFAHTACHDDAVRAIVDAAMARPRTTSVVDPDAPPFGDRHSSEKGHRRAQACISPPITGRATSVEAEHVGPPALPDSPSPERDPRVAGNAGSVATWLVPTATGGIEVVAASQAGSHRSPSAHGAGRQRLINARRKTPNAAQVAAAWIQLSVK